MRFLVFLLIMSLLFIASCKEDDPTEPPPPCNLNGEDAILADIKANTDADVVKVMTRNIYIGADVDIVLEAEDILDIPVLAAEAYAILQQTNFNARAVLLAEEVAKSLPHLIALQEVTLVYRQSPSDFLAGNPVEASDLEWDYLAILMSALNAKGLNYEIVDEIRNANIELPMFVGLDAQLEPLLDDIRIVDRDVILRRSDVQASNIWKGNFQAVLPVDTTYGLIIPRGYVSAEVQVGDNSYRFVNTHLEALAGDIGDLLRTAQATELLLVHSQKKLPIIMTGDFNTAAPSNDTYQFILSSGYKDAWDNNTETYTYNAEGNTYGHYGNKGDLSNTTVNMFERIDLVFVRAEVDPTWGPVVVVGDEPCEKVGGLWPSDHAGVITLMQFQTD